MAIEQLAEVDERADRLVDRAAGQFTDGERAVAEPHRDPLGLDPDQRAAGRVARVFGVWHSLA